MDIFLEVVLWLGVFAASFSVICVGISFGQYLTRKIKLFFEQYIKNSWIGRSTEKLFEQYIKDGWIARNFDLIARVIVLLIFVLGGVYSAELLDLINSIAKKYNTIMHYIFNNPSVLVALLVFLILIKNGWIARNFDLTASVIVLLVGVGFFVSSDWFLGLVSSEAKKYNTFGYYVFSNPLVLVTLLGFPILIKRFDEMRLQTRVSQENLKEAQKQSRTNQYREARDLLFSENLNSRIMGIADLWRFAETHPKEEYHKVMDVFALFIKNPIPYELDEERKNKHQNLKSVNPQYFKQKTPAGERTDISAILRHIGKGSVEGATPHRINLSHAHLEKSYLRYARLEEAYLSHAHLQGADLAFANLDGANLAFVNLDEAILYRASLNAAYLQGAHLERAHLCDAHLRDAYLQGAYLHDADLGDAYLRDAYLGVANLRDANLEGADLHDANLDGADLKGANLKETHLQGADLCVAHLEGADLEEADLRLALINGANFTNAENLTQEQIDSCVLITDPPHYIKPPILPEGMESTYKKMTQKEWDEAIKQAYPS